MKPKCKQCKQSDVILHYFKVDPIEKDLQFCSTDCLLKFEDEIKNPWTYDFRPHEIVKAWENGYEIEFSQDPKNPSVGWGKVHSGLFDFEYKQYRVRENK